MVTGAARAEAQAGSSASDEGGLGSGAEAEVAPPPEYMQECARADAGPFVCSAMNAGMIRTTARIMRMRAKSTQQGQSIFYPFMCEY